MQLSSMARKGLAMKISERQLIVNKQVTEQTGIDSFRDCFVTKVFPLSATIKEILEWAKTDNITKLYFNIQESIDD